MKKPGRPKGNNNKKFSYTLRMDENTLQRLEAYCQKMGVMKSQAIRTAIERLDFNENIDYKQ